MQTIIWLWVGTVALMLSVGAVLTGLDKGTRVLSGAASMALWGVWGLSATDVTKITETGEKVSQSYQSLSWIGLAMAGMMLLFVAEQVFQLLGER